MELLANISQTASVMFVLSLLYIVLYVLISTESAKAIAYESNTAFPAFLIMLLSFTVLALALFTQLMIYIWS